jgi:hypothetical protein
LVNTKVSPENERPISRTRSVCKWHKIRCDLRLEVPEAF